MYKKVDMLKFYDKVEYCCCYGDSAFDERSKIINQAIRLNHVLMDQYCICDDDNNEFINFYRKYRDWLVEKYINRQSFFTGKYIDCFSMKERKHWNIKEFKEIFVYGLEKELFFAQTFREFASKALQTEGTESLTTHKMYYGVLLILELVGIYYYDWETSNEKEIIDALLRKQGGR